MTDASMMDIASKTYGTVSAERQNEMSGLEFVQGLVDGTLPLNTIAQTLGYDVTEAASGRVVVTAEPSGIHLNPAGSASMGESRPPGLPPRKDRTIHSRISECGRGKSAGSRCRWF